MIANEIKSLKSSRVAALAEVLIAFVLTHVSYRALKYFTPIGAWEAAARTSFTSGGVWILWTIVVLLLFRRDASDYGLGLASWRPRLSIGVVCCVLMLIWECGALAATGVQVDFSKPPDPHAHMPIWRALQLAIVALPAFVIILVLIRKNLAFAGRLPLAASLPILVVLFCFMPLLAMYLNRPSMWVRAFWMFFGAGFGEEIFFRGYIQSRMDQAFGRPWRSFGFEVGWGLVVSSLLFGLVHALNTVDYFHGRFDWGWWFGAQSVCVGSFFGLCRTRTGSVLPGSVIHGIGDCFARIPNLMS